MSQNCIAITFLADATKSSSVHFFIKLPSLTHVAGLSPPMKMEGKKVFPDFLRKSRFFYLETLSQCIKQKE